MDRHLSAAWTGASFAAFAADSTEAAEGTLERLLEEQTPGGLNEKVGRTFWAETFWMDFAQDFLPKM